jgi:hypothetical protein
MSALTSYQGEVHNGVVRLQNGKLREGAKVIIVAVEDQTLSVDEQLRRLESIPLNEWRRPFDEYVEFARQHPAEVDIDTISDEELDAIVHEVRAVMLAKP